MYAKELKKIKPILGLATSVLYLRLLSRVCLRLSI